MASNISGSVELSVHTVPLDKPVRKLPRHNENDPATFEQAITETKFGKFNYFLLFISIPATFSAIFETTTMSYVFAAAQCDLDLSLDDKGFLNAITYLGMIVSASIWGFLFDTLGRKRLLIIGFLADACFVFMSVFSQDIILLMVSKFLGGFIINGPFAAMSSYLSEFHSAQYRPRIQLVIGTLNSFGSVVLPLLAWVVLPQEWNFSFFGESLKFHSWNVYLLVCGLPAASSGIIFLFLPESPKFLMTCGQNEKALEVFRRVYRINTGKSEDTFPIKKLVDETLLDEDKKHGGHVTKNRSKIVALKEGFQQIAPLFYPPYISKLILVCTIQMCFVMSLNMLRLWMPSIFQAINDYQHYHNGSSASLCTMLEMLTPSNVTGGECKVNMDNSSVYINSIIVGSTTMCGYVVAGSLITMIGKKKMLISLGFLAGCFCFGIYFAQDTGMTIAMSSLYIALNSISANVLLAVIVDLFPTTLRTLTVSLAMMLARTGAMIGNLLIPILLRAGCAPPFFVIGGIVLASSVLGLLLPNTDNKALK